MAIVIPITFACCSGSNSESKTTEATASPTPSYDNTLAKGKVTDSVICRAQNNVSYALYLPSYYTSEKKFPCIFFFDSHARGSLPVNTYKDIAEKYGFVLAGSNVSKNGLSFDVVNDGAKAMIADSRARINIDPQRIYTSGFSGGSRVASSVAVTDGGVAGVIGCAAGLQQGPQSKFDYFGIVGLYDFNLSEMEQLDEALEQNGFSHQLLTFSGIHSWPSPADFQTAVLWLQVNAMKENRQPKSDSIIAAFKNDLDKRISDANTSADLIAEQQLLSGLVRTLNGSTDVTTYQKQLGDLVARTDYKNAIALQQQLQQTESSLQHELGSEFTQHDENWWSKKIAELNQNVKTAKTKLESQMYRRTVNYLGLVGYMSASNALNSGDLANASTYLKVFRMADPKNPDCDYLSAIYFVKSGNNSDAIASLKNAAQSGYSDIQQLTNDPSFAGLRQDEGFKNIITQVKRNYSGNNL